MVVSNEAKAELFGGRSRLDFVTAMVDCVLVRFFFVAVLHFCYETRQSPGWCRNFGSTLPMPIGSSAQITAAATKTIITILVLTFLCYPMQTCRQFW